MATRQIMIVDDDPITVSILSRIVASEGYSVAECENGTVALESALKAKPDLVLLDLMMPSPDPRVCNRFDGFSVLRWIKKMGMLKDVPVIIISAKPAAECKQTTLQEGAVAYIEKPFDREKLIAAVEIALTEPKHMSANVELRPASSNPAERGDPEEWLSSPQLPQFTRAELRQLAR